MKELIFKIITNPRINFILRNFYKLIPIKNKKRFPFVGLLKYKISNNNYIKMYSNGSDTIVSYLYWKVKYEKPVIDLWIKNLNNNSVILDIGANTGIFSLIASKLTNKSKIFAFEPTPRILDFLKKNVLLNDVERKIYVCNKAVSNHIGKTYFHVVNSLTIPLGSSENKDFRNGLTNKIQVEVTTIDDFLKEQEINHVDLVKIDTESTEPYVLEGMINMLNNCKPNIICEILTNEASDKIQEILIPLGYKFYLIKDNELEKEDVLKPDTIYHNHYFTINPV